MKKFEISTSTATQDDLTVNIVKVQGFLDSSTFPELQGVLENLIKEEQYNIVVELGDLNYISSAGIGVLMGMLQDLRGRDGDLKIANMTPKIRNLFDMLGFSRLIRIYDSQEEAVRGFTEDKKNVVNLFDENTAEENY